MDNLNRFLRQNFAAKSADPAFARFSRPTPPPIQLLTYMEHLDYYLQLSQAEWKLATTYLQRLLQMRPGLKLTVGNVHRLLLCTVLAAYKQSHDLVLSNAQIARFAGVNLPELNVLERVFLAGLDWNLAWEEPEEVAASSSGESTRSQDSSDDEWAAADCSFSELLVFKR